jgi:hypothetical protein
VASQVGHGNKHESEASRGPTRRIWAKYPSIRPISRKTIPFITNICRTLHDNFPSKRYFFALQDISLSRDLISNKEINLNKSQMKHV